MRLTEDEPAAVPDRAATLRHFDALARLSRRLGRPFAVVRVEVGEPGSASREDLGPALRAVVRGGDVLGRLGPTSFLAVLALAGDELEAFAAAERLLATAREVGAGRRRERRRGGPPAGRQRAGRPAAEPPPPPRPPATARPPPPRRACAGTAPQALAPLHARAALRRV